MITKCDICRKKFRFTKNCVTLVSGSITGKIVVSYACEKCSKNREKMKNLMLKNDKILDIMDSTEELPC